MNSVVAGNDGALVATVDGDKEVVMAASGKELNEIFHSGRDDNQVGGKG